MNLEALMPFAPYALQALGGAVGGNITGLITRGGGGFMGRTLIGALAGLGAGFAVQQVPELASIARNWEGLLAGADGERLANVITGACGGGLLGVVTGLLIRPRR